jgi:hypothetical protein
VAGRNTTIIVAILASQTELCPAMAATRTVEIPE